MPSPIAHMTAGYILYRLAHRRWSSLDSRRLGPFPRLLVITTGFSMLPDIDSAMGVLVGDFGRFHNNVTHSLIVGLAVALVSAAIVGLQPQHRFWPWFIVIFACYALHVLMDAATVGRGVMAYWPLSQLRWKAAVILFYGLHWSDGWLSSRHALTLVTELAVLGVVLVIERRLAPRLAAALER